MTMTISAKCVGCHACYNVCPNKAVYRNPDGKPEFAIRQQRCNGCEGQFEQRQCAEICPIEEAICYYGEPLNPRYSLTPA